MEIARRHPAPVYRAPTVRARRPVRRIVVTLVGSAIVVVVAQRWMPEIGVAAGALLGVLAVGALFYTRGRRSDNVRRAAALGAAGLLAILAVASLSVAPRGTRTPVPGARAVAGATLTVMTTAYCTTGVTAAGSWTEHGTIAATLPFGTRVYIPGYGQGTVLDRGALVGPGHLDLYVANCDRARAWGVKIQRVHVRY